MDTQVMSELINQNKERIIKLETKIDMGFKQMGDDIKEISNTLKKLPEELNKTYVRKDFYEIKHKEIVEFRDETKKYFFWFVTTVGAMIIGSVLFLVMEFK